MPSSLFVKNFIFFSNEYRLLLRSYLLGILFFTVIRVLLLFVNWDYALELPAHSRLSLILTSFFYGLRFDTVISGYILAIPFLVLSITSFFKKRFLFPYRFSLIIMLILYFVSFFICLANIPYFKYCFTNISVVVFNWIEDYKFSTNMVLQDFSMLFYLLLFIPFYLIFAFLLYKIYRKSISLDETFGKSNLVFYISRSFLFIVFTLIIFIAIRGRVEKKSPIRIGTAYFSEYSFANQLGLNPTFTLLASTLERKKINSKRIKFMKDEEAVKYCDKYFNFDNPPVPTPISRKILVKDNPNKKNVVLVIMESMAAVRMGYFGNQNNLTPYLDSLSEISTSFNNFYTAGIHTYSGVYSTLFSHPTIWDKHPMKPALIPNIHSIIEELKNNNYHNYFFVAHDDQFDNMGGFLYANGFEKIFCERDFPAQWRLSTLGVPDHILFEETVKKLSELKEDKPFFAAILTASNHDPKIIPEGISFKAQAQKEDEKLVQYCDWSLKHFMEMASKSDWFDNTIFVFVADHGRSIKQPYNIPISFFHSPFIIYSPGEQSTGVIINKLASQIDVLPTIAGLLNIEYTNSTLGIDLLKETRPYVYFSNDNALGVLNNKYFLIEKEDSQYSLYEYGTQSIKNLANERYATVDSMANYLHAMLQTSQFILENHSFLHQ